MCDHRQLGNASSPGEIDHVHMLSEDIGNLFLDDKCTDITLIVGTHRFPAHKVILASRCEYFRALLFGGMRESSTSLTEIDLHEEKPQAFSTLLTYIYTGRVHLSQLKEEQILDLLGLANKYGFSQLEAAISDHLRLSLNESNVCVLYDMACVYILDKLSQECLLYIDRHATDIIKSDGFLQMTKGSVINVISRSSFCAPEISIFDAIVSWSKHRDEEITEVLTHCRFSLMSLNDLLRRVRPTNLVDPNQILDAIDRKQHCKDTELDYRGALIPEENMASLRRDALVHKGEMKSALLDGDVSNFDLDRGYTRHGIDDEDTEGVVVELGQPTIINTIRLLLWDKDTRSYAYYVEVSMDGEDWMRVVDHSKYLCRSWQTLHFDCRVVKFIKVVGTHNTVNRVFHAVALEALYTTKRFDLNSDGLLIPYENVATEAHSAFVIEGVSRTRNSLINGDVTSYDWDSGYTCHQLGNGAIIVQLAQPYVVDSMRLLLWDRDERLYSYTVEVSVDNSNWIMVQDNSKDRCQSWQTIRFNARPVSFIKIVGTYNSANEVFHLVHFECPAMSTSSSRTLITQPPDLAVQEMVGPTSALDQSLTAPAAPVTSPSSTNAHVKNDSTSSSQYNADLTED